MCHGWPRVSGGGTHLKLLDAGNHTRTALLAALMALLLIAMSLAVLGLLRGAYAYAALWGLACAAVSYLLLVDLVGERRFKTVLILPAGFILFLTSALPIGYMLYTSVFDVELLTFNSDWVFVGLKNYVDLLFHDRLLWDVMLRTLEFVVLSVGLQIVFGMSLALLVNRDIPGKKLLQAVLMLPVLTTPVVVAMLWKYMFDNSTGLLNQLLRLVHLPAQPWLSNKGLPLVSAIPVVGDWLVSNLNMTYGFLSLIIVTVWQWTPFCFLVFYAGLASLPVEPFEAATVDGATSWQTFRYITLPLLRPLIGVVVIIRVIDLLKLYAPLWVLFGNAVNMRVLNTHLYTLGLVTHEYSKSSALGVVSLLIVLGFSLAMSKWLGEGERGS